MVAIILFKKHMLELGGKGQNSLSAAFRNHYRAGSGAKLCLRVSLKPAPTV